MTENSYQAKVRNKATPAVYLILLRGNGEILLCLRKNTGYQDGMWELPAGHVDASELPTEAMIREAKEEIGISLYKHNIELVHTSYRPTHDNTGDRVDFVFLCRNGLFHRPVVCEPEKCEKIEWRDLLDLPENMVPHVKEFVALWREGEPFSEFGLDWLKQNGLYKL